MKKIFQCGLFLWMGCTTCSRAAEVIYDLVDGLASNMPAGVNGSPAGQTGNQGWFYRYEPVTPWGAWAHQPIDRDPVNFVPMELGYDGTGASYGWAANLGFAIGDRGVVRNGDWTNRRARNGTGVGDAIWVNAENSVQVVIEWKAPRAGTADIDLELAGRNHADTDLQWHIGTWDGGAWTDHGFVVVTQVETPASPASLGANGLMLAAGESIYIYGHVYDHDAWDGTVLRGGITFNTQVTGVDLALTKEVDAATLFSGTNLIYTIGVTNQGSEWAGNVVVMDRLPDEAAFLTSDPPPTTQTNRTNGFFLGFLPPGGGTTIVVTVSVTSAVPGVITNWAWATTTNTESDVGNNQASAVTVLPDTDGDGLANPGDPDDDNDRMPDEAESIANTDSLDANSYLWIRIARTSTQDIQILTFPTSTGRMYQVEKATNLWSGLWIDVATNLVGDGNDYMTPVSNLVEWLYYRVGVEAP